MTESDDRSRGVPHSEPDPGNRHDMQIDEETGRPVPIEPDGEKENRPARVTPDERLRIDPESRIPRPVQPDLA